MREGPLELKDIPLHVLEGLRIKWEGCLKQNKVNWQSCSLCHYLDTLNKQCPQCPLPGIRYKGGLPYCDFSAKGSELGQREPSRWRPAAKAFVAMVKKEIYIRSWWYYWTRESTLNLLTDID